MTKTVNDLYLEFRKILKKAGIFSADLEARELCAFACGQDKHKLAGWGYVYLSEETESYARELLDRRLKEEPLAYLIREWDFYGMTFKVTPDVLIPRSDTEALCQMVINRANEIVNPRVLDLCCGSGCIGISIAKNAQPVRVVGADISMEALAVSRYNGHLHELDKNYIAVQADAKKPYDGRLGVFHILVSNPPYISKKEMDDLDDGVKKYEPELALYGGTDGLDFYRSIAENWKNAILPGGMIMFECGWRQAPLVADILDCNHYENIEFHEDLSGVQRIVTGTRNQQDEQMLHDIEPFSII